MKKLQNLETADKLNFFLILFSVAYIAQGVLFSFPPEWLLEYL